MSLKYLYSHQSIANTRAKVIEWFAQLPPAKVGIEACDGAHYWARALSVLASWPVPRPFATAVTLPPSWGSCLGRVRLLGISKRGDRYVRSLLIHGARALFRHLGQKSDPVSQWLRGLVARRGVNKAVVALANKNARIVWALLAQGGRYCPRQAGGLR